jgi:hypothetical protein
MGLYLEFEVDPTGAGGGGHVDVVGPLRLAEGVQIKVQPTAPGGWDSLASGDVMTYKNDATPGLQKFRVAWNDTTFMNQWCIKLGANSNQLGDYSVSASANINVSQISVHG